jgi:hypothetical protein
MSAYKEDTALVLGCCLFCGGKTLTLYGPLDSHTSRRRRTIRSATKRRRLPMKYMVSPIEWAKLPVADMASSQAKKAKAEEEKEEEDEEKKDKKDEEEVRCICPSSESGTTSDRLFRLTG